MLPSEVSARRPIYLCWKSRSASFRIRLGSWSRWVVKSSQRVAITTIYNTRIWYYRILQYITSIFQCVLRLRPAYRSHGSIMKWLCPAYVKPVEPVWRSCCSQVRRVSGGNRFFWSCRTKTLTAEGNKTKQKTSKDNNIFMNSFVKIMLNISIFRFIPFLDHWIIPH